MSTYFFKNDEVFPLGISKEFEKIANHSEIKFENRGDTIRFSKKVNDGYMINDEVLIIGVKKNEEGLYNYWKDYIYNGKHRYYGPGYPSHAIHEQEPMSEEELIEIIKSNLVNLLAY